MKNLIATIILLLFASGAQAELLIQYDSGDTLGKWEEFSKKQNEELSKISSKIKSGELGFGLCETYDGKGLAAGLRCVGSSSVQLSQIDRDVTCSVLNKLFSETYNLAIGQGPVHFYERVLSVAKSLDCDLNLTTKF